VGGAWLTVLLVAASLAAAGGPALAQTPIDTTLDENSARRIDNLEKVVRELRAIVYQGRDTGAPVVIQPADTQGQINALSERVSDLDHTLTLLNGEMEVVRHDLDQARSEADTLRAQNAALTEQVNALSQTVKTLTPPPPPPPTAAEPPPEAAAPPPSADPATAFAAARDLWLSGAAADAEAAFRAFDDKYGDTRFAAEAHYYLGKTLAARQAWPEAATADIGAIRGWPRTRWAPDAIVDLSRALTALGKTTDACQALAEMDRRYTKIPPAVLSAARSVRQQAACH
jgi:TolA-binding protein